jgi:glutaminyl-peptide cyclotransferase
MKLETKVTNIILLISLVFISGCNLRPSPEIFGRSAEDGFQAERAFQDILYQTSLGPRISGSPAHQQVRKWISEQLELAGWQVEEQKTVQNGMPVRNLIASRGKETPYILLGAHYDSRLLADQDPDQALRDQPVPGANDGASGVAVLLELARSLPADLPVDVRLVFFDAEDNGGIGNWDWILGSRAFVRELQERPQAVIIIDMIGDADLQLYYEKNSDEALRKAIWDKAEQLGYGSAFIPEEKFSMLDDHTPFIEAGIPAVDIIDFDYPYWHTTLDTADKVSQESLAAVGETLTSWLSGLD